MMSIMQEAPKSSMAAANVTSRRPAVPNAASPSSGYPYMLILSCATAAHEYAVVPTPLGCTMCGLQCATCAIKCCSNFELFTSLAQYWHATHEQRPPNRRRGKCVFFAALLSSRAIESSRQYQFMQSHVQQILKESCLYLARGGIGEEVQAP